MAEFEFTDSPTVNLSQTGGVLKGDVIIDPDPSNALTATAGGLMVAPSTGGADTDEQFITSADGSVNVVPTTQAGGRLDYDLSVKQGYFEVPFADVQSNLVLANWNGQDFSAFLSSALISVFCDGKHITMSGLLDFTNISPTIAVPNDGNLSVQLDAVAIGQGVGAITTTNANTQSITSIGNVYPSGVDSGTPFDTQEYPTRVTLPSSGILSIFLADFQSSGNAGTIAPVGVSRVRTRFDIMFPIN